MERREYPRIDTRLRCELQRAEELYAGVTVNLSRTGALIELDEDCTAVFSPGEPVVLRVAMPKRPLFEPKCMECCGVVARAKPGAARSTLALSLESVRFQTAERMLACEPAEAAALRGNGHVN